LEYTNRIIPSIISFIIIKKYIYIKKSIEHKKKIFKKFLICKKLNYVKINCLNIKSKYLLQIYTFKYNETRTKAALEEEEEEADRSWDHRANKGMHIYHPSMI